MTQPTANAIVTVTKDGKKYDVVVVPDPLVVTQPDTLVTFTLSADTPSTITITGLDFPGGDDDQISNVVIAPDGRSISFTDACTKKIKLHGLLDFADSDALGLGGEKFHFEHDPEVDNNPTH